jgi:PIN domain nuclease of toxin-antitoxin system
MKFLLDTHFIIWIPIDDRRMGREARSLLVDPANEFAFSVASFWEIAIKKSQKRLEFAVDPREIRRHMKANGYEELAVEGSHAVAVASLPPIHKDPFDRILIAQAMVEGITLLTDDAVVAQYPGPIRKT